MEDIKETLMRGAKNGGICAEGYEHMRVSNIDSLIDYYIENPDWCLERGFPGLDVLRSEFSDIEFKGIYIDKEFNGELLNDTQAYIFHNCRGVVRVGLNVYESIIPMMYFANGCKMRLIGVGEDIKGVKLPPTWVPLYIFGKNDIQARDNKYVKFAKNKYKLL